MAIESAYCFGPYRLFPAQRLLFKDKEKIEVGSRAFDVLLALTEVAGELVGQRELLERAWSNVVAEGSLRVTIAALRKILGEGIDGARYIQNVTGRGYCFVAEVTREDNMPPALGTTGQSARIQHTAGLLPSRLTRMVGRDAELETVSLLLLSRRFVSIVGTGGMGKTTVAVSTAHAMRDVFDDAVYFVDLSAISDRSLVSSTVAAALGVVAPTQDPTPNILAFCRDRRIMLILDNCEHVIEAVAGLSERLYGEAGDVYILTTSREALRVEGEHVHILAPLQCPLIVDNLTAIEALKCSSVQLFMERAYAAGYRVELTDDDAPLVAGICRRLDGIAFAIELAASRVAAYGLQPTCDLLSNRFRLLWQGRRSAPPRQQTLAAMVDWSYNLLSAKERLVLVRLSVFVGAFTLEAAEKVLVDDDISSTEVAEAITSLVDKSLIWIVISDGIPHYRLLDVTLAYAAEKLAQAAGANAVSQRHAEFFASWLPKDIEADFAAFGPQVGNIRAALEWCFGETGDKTIGLALAASSAPIFFALSLFQECNRICELGLSAFATETGNERAQLALQSTRAACLMFTRGNSDEIRHLLEVSFEQAVALGETSYQFHLLSGLSIALTRSGEFLTAVEVARKGLPIAQVIGSPKAIAVAEWMLGVALHLAGDQAAALVHCEAGFNEISARAPERIVYFGYDHRLRALVALARSEWLAGFPDRAAVTARLAVDGAADGIHPVNMCISMIYSATVFLWRSDFDEAESLIRKLQVYAARHFLAPYQAVGSALTGTLAVARGDVESGILTLRTALGTLGSQHYYTLTTLFQKALAEGLMISGDLRSAGEVVDEALQRCKALGEELGVAELLCLRGKINCHLDRSAAEQDYMLSIEHARRQSALSLELQAANELARLWSDRQNSREAINLLDSIVGRFTEGFDTPDMVIAENLLSELKKQSFSTSEARNNAT
ncbi:transcriptional regulator [Neorhizobium sp. P12A]|uniref:ATP-binding protein n=1 Tax=Neorhizobium sp. P12A TaxID=2268027 RepID=UPI0011EBAA34|nr:winged helix-turn-helix domain-containing protein [Neorhizobium sp. P12A]KAA0686888.1 transcriptional regulator [Neorhizobium sp. P12A]